jgi:hypothetical protein
MIDLVSPVLDVLQIAHDLGYPHQEPAPAKSGGGASVIIVVAAIVVSLIAVAGLIWLKRRVDG